MRIYHILRTGIDTTNANTLSFLVFVKYMFEILEKMKIKSNVIDWFPLYYDVQMDESTIKSHSFNSQSYL